MKKLCCALISAAALTGCVLPATADAHGSLVRCRPGAADRQWAVHDIVTNRVAGCALARHFAASFQRGGFDAGDPARVKYTNRGSSYTFRMRYAYFPNANDGNYRIQGYGQPYGVFVSYETSE